jgi:hypothetical protein
VSAEAPPFRRTKVSHHALRHKSAMFLCGFTPAWFRLRLCSALRGAVLLRYRKMNWNDAAEDLLNSILAQTPRPEREAAETKLKNQAEGIAEDDGMNRVGVETVIRAWVETTPAPLRPDLPRLMQRFGLDPEEYRHLL